MKKFFLLAVLLTLGGLAHTALAQQACPSGANGSDANGNPVECPGDESCVNGICQGPTGAPAPGSTSGGSGYVPLAPIPGLDQTIQTSSSGIASFLSTLYTYLIGIAAALAVIEIIWGGLEIATKDSVSKNRDGKDRIWQALLGLVLVLAPILVFTIINPSILQLNNAMPALNLNQNSTFGSVSPPVQPNQTLPTQSSYNNQVNLTPTTCGSNLVSSCSNAQASCNSQNEFGSSAVYDDICIIPSTGAQDSQNPEPTNGQCPSTDYAEVNCNQANFGAGYHGP